MLTHIVLFKAADGVDPARLGEQLNEMRTLNISGLLSVEVAPDLGLREGNWDYALVCRFPSADDYERYDADADHGLIKERIKPLAQAIARIQVEVPSA